MLRNAFENTCKCVETGKWWEDSDSTADINAILCRMFRSVQRKEVRTCVKDLIANPGLDKSSDIADITLVGLMAAPVRLELANCNAACT
jgi:hypothetical protein